MSPHEIGSNRSDLRGFMDFKGDFNGIHGFKGSQGTTAPITSITSHIRTASPWPREHIVIDSQYGNEYGVISNMMDIEW